MRHKTEEIPPVTVTQERMVRTPVGLLVAFIVATISGAVWCTCVWRDVQDLKRDMDEVKALLHTTMQMRPIVAQEKE